MDQVLTYFLPGPFVAIRLPISLVFFVWEAAWGKVLTLDQLKRRGRALANICYLCKDEDESVEQFLLHCSKARML